MFRLILTALAVTPGLTDSALQLAAEVLRGSRRQRAQKCADFIDVKGGPLSAVIEALAHLLAHALE